MKDKVLGRGLKELFQENDFDIINEGEVIKNISLEEITSNPYQPRKHFDEEKIKDLANSIKEQGVVQPIILTKSSKGYVIVSGERRFRASKSLGLKEIPSIVRNYDIKQMAEIALIENVQREDLTPIEEALGYKNIIDLLKYTQKEVADRVGKSRSHITNLLGLLTLPENIQKMVVDKEISMGHARVLSKLKDHNRINQLANEIVKCSLSVREIEEISQAEVKVKVIKKKENNPTYKLIEKEIKNKFNLKLKIGENKATIKFEDKENFINIIKLLLGEDYDL